MPVYTTPKIGPKAGITTAPASSARWSNRNNPARNTINISPQLYSVDRSHRSGTIPFTENTIIPYLPSRYNKSYVFFNWRDLKVFRAATVAAPKNAGDENNIFKEGGINKVLSDCIIPFKTININHYNDKTISIYTNYGHVLVNQNLSDETKEALDLVDKSNIISLGLSQTLREVIYSSVISGNLDLYSPKVFREMYEVGEATFGNTLPLLTTDPSLNWVNALTYISKNLNSLYPKNFTNGDDSRFAAHWLALPPEYQLALGVTQRVGDPAAIRVGLNFNFPVYDQDGTERKVNEFLDFFDVLEREGPTERVVPLRSNRSNLYTLDRHKQSRIVDLMEEGPAPQSTTTYTVSCLDLDKVTSLETNTTPITLKESYLVKLELSSIGSAGGGEYERKYTATYNKVWEAGDDENIFDTAVNTPKPVCGPTRVVYLPQDPWWAYFVNGGYSVSADFSFLNVEGSLPGMPEAIVGSQLPYTLLLVPTKDKVYKNPFNGQSDYSAKTRSFTTTLSPFTESEVYTKPIKNSTEINLQGKYDEFSMKFAKDFTEGDLTKASVTDATDYTTCASDLGKFILRVEDLKDNYDLKFDGVDTLTQFDLYKGFSLNQLLQIMSIDLKDAMTITGVKVILNKTYDRDTPNSFITEADLLPGKTANTTNYIGSETIPTILYFPPKYEYYN
tara:strand:+ start:2417 stop:4441 length:2025 start_codon:yes stop_codon:yes gene_type:complete